ncbi:S8 family peptidase [bacterium]|nr:S8 family peptidase [bacterium]
MKQVFFISLLVLFQFMIPSHDLPAADFQYKIVPAMHRDPAFIPAGGQEKMRTVGAIMYPPDWLTVQYVEGDLLYKPGPGESVSEFLGRCKGTVINEGVLPEPDQKIAHLARTIPDRSGWVRIQVPADSSDIDFNALKSHAEAQGYTGMHVFSSWKMLALFAILVEAWDEDIKGVDFNRVLNEARCPRTSSQEYAPYGHNPADINEGHSNAYTQPQFWDPEIQVSKAWMIMDLFDLTGYTVPVAVIDGGFYMNDDFPFNSPYDFVDGDYAVDASERDYHGHKVLSMAAAKKNNAFGAAGTGGSVILPMPFRYDFSWYEMASAIRTGTAWGAGVINISSAAVDSRIRSDHDPVTDALNEAYDNGVVVVVGMGNDEIDFDSSDDYLLPGELGSSGKRPLCIGAIDLLTKRAVRMSDGFAWGSNYGGPLDIWAPGGPESAILVSPLSNDVTEIEHFDGTSCAAPYVSGVVAMMKALNPDLNTSDVRSILTSTANTTSPDGRVSEGFLNAYEAVRAASDGAIPDPGALEPNDFRNFYRLHGGSVCSSLSPADDEDGYTFYLDDFILADLSDTSHFGFDAYTLEMTGPRLGGAVSFPFADTLSPGAYHLRLAPTSEDPAFYTLMLDITTPLTIERDAYESNNVLSGCAPLVYPEEQVNGMWDVTDLNFHWTGDADFFELILPDLPDVDYQDEMTLFVEPDARGTYHLSGFDLSVYDPAGEETSYGVSATLEDVRDYFPDGRIRFCVRPFGNRNFYHIEIYYDQHQRGVYVPPEYRLMETPEWLDAMRDMYFMYVPPAATDGIPIPYTYPSDPDVLENLSPDHTTWPPEIMILTWEKAVDFEAVFSFTGDAGDLGFSLLDGSGQIIAEDRIRGMGKSSRRESAGGLISKVLSYPDLPRGFYGIQVEGTRGPVPYVMTVDTVATTPVKRQDAAALPVHLDVGQNYPNPFNNRTTIPFSLCEADRVVIRVFDVQGRETGCFIDQDAEPGFHEKVLEADSWQSGIYFYRVESGGFEQTRKMILIR